ncbi:hypothetical protein EI77_00703 [Prosthecobacter fusiformis]|uniref:Uncharacterized protein n=1 Tax=Prosthecobacter fusiformis TaxID=48464 RepID=A0A4R7SRR6_9BACT|nr:hypothetical protein [Prosthecobacter fusiformis]TDU81395.1 hypothetical protein EI77_00703 [Prosthecobacter fusiformis]
MEPLSNHYALLRILKIAALLLSASLLSHCTSHPYRGDAARYSTPATSPAVEENSIAKSRPGLGTELGHELTDTSSTATFYRKSTGQPDAMATFHYNDDEGARLMASLQGRPARRDGGFELIPGKLRVTVMDGSRYSSSALDHYESGQGIFVIGTPGENYSLKLANRTSRRMEVVVSVDGLSLLDGQPASARKPGYIIPAKSAVILRGMRVGGKLYSLEFGSVKESRASTAFGQKGARNVGVIGMACYEEDEIVRRRAQVEESYVREGARAFGS